MALLGEAAVLERPTAASDEAIAAYAAIGARADARPAAVGARGCSAPAVLALRRSARAEAEVAAWTYLWADGRASSPTRRSPATRWRCVVQGRAPRATRRGRCGSGWSSVADATLRRHRRSPTTCCGRWPSWPSTSWAILAAARALYDRIPGDHPDQRAARRRAVAGGGGWRRARGDGAGAAEPAARAARDPRGRAGRRLATSRCGSTTRSSRWPGSCCAIDLRRPARRGRGARVGCPSDYPAVDPRRRRARSSWPRSRQARGGDRRTRVRRRRRGSAPRSGRTSRFMLERGPALARRGSGAPGPHRPMPVDPL
jgi:hypothetical protein